MKNCKNDRSDASLQVYHLDDVHGSRAGARPPSRAAVTKNVYMSLGSGTLSGDKTTRCVLLKKIKIPFIPKMRVLLVLQLKK